MRERLGRYHYLLIIGCGPRAREMATLIEESRGMGLRLVGFVDPDSGDSPTPNLGGYEVFPLSSVGSILQNHVVDEIVFAVDLLELGGAGAENGGGIAETLQQLPDADRTDSVNHI